MTDDNTRLAVLIDADNTPAKLTKEMLEELAGFGKLTVKRAYGDWTNPHLNGWRDVLLGNAISPQQQFAYTVGKNATDSALIIDAMDLLYSGNVDGFAIVSSDSDFTPLATRLRESGKRVIGVGQNKTPKAFREACDRFVYLEVLGGDTTAVPKATAAREDRQPPIQSVLTKALNKVDADDDDWTSLSALGNHLNRTDPSFDPRNYASGKLSDLVKAQPYIETKTITGTNGREHLWVRLKRRRPAGTDSNDSPSEKAPVSSATKKSASNESGSKEARAKKAGAKKPSTKKGSTKKATAKKGAAKS